MGVDILTFTETVAEAFTQSEGIERREQETLVRESGMDAQDERELSLSSYVPTNDCNELDVKRFHHWDVNVELQVPVISYTHCVCAPVTLLSVDKPARPRTFWASASSLHDSLGTSHPGNMTHDL